MFGVKIWGNISFIGIKFILCLFHEFGIYRIKFVIVIGRINENSFEKQKKNNFFNISESAYKIQSLDMENTLKTYLKIIKNKLQI